MKKTILKNVLLVNLSAVLCAISAQAENVFIDCSVPNEQCDPLYQADNLYDATTTQMANASGKVYSVAPIARTSTAPLAVSQPYTPQNETLILVNGQPVVQKNVAIPQPLAAPTVATVAVQAPVPVKVANSVLVTENGQPVPVEEAFVAPTQVPQTEAPAAPVVPDEKPVVVVTTSVPTEAAETPAVVVATPEPAVASDTPVAAALTTQSQNTQTPTKVEALAPSETFKTSGEIPAVAVPLLKSSEIAPPYVEKEPVKEYAVKDVPDGSIITQKETTVHKNEDGSIIEISRVKETVISPRKVDLPPISSVQRTHKIAYGTSVHDWEAPKGESLRTLLTDWGEKSGWTIVWQLERDYILEAGVVFRGTFTDVASAILRTFARAMPAPVGTFYNGNRVLLITTQEDDNAQ